jgi:hypothetical protein
LAPITPALSRPAGPSPRGTHRFMTEYPGTAMSLANECLAAGFTPVCLPGRVCGFPVVQVMAARFDRTVRRGVFHRDPNVRAYYTVVLVEKAWRRARKQGLTPL